MNRKEFIGKGLAAGALLTPAATIHASSSDKVDVQKISAPKEEEIFIEREVKGRPHEGKVLAAIQPHCDDIAFYAAGTVAKLINEGYTGYMIRTSNDDAAGRGATTGERVYNNEIGTNSTAKALGLKKVYDLGYRNHRMDEYNIQEIKGRLIFLFRMLKVDTIICYDPYGAYEENPDHYITARAVEAASWMAGMGSDYSEQVEAVGRHGVSEKYYFARGPQIVNRVVETTSYIDKKVEANTANIYQGPGISGAAWRQSLAEQGKKLPILGDSDESANESYIKNFMMDMDSMAIRGVPSDKEIGKQYGLEWAERFHYIGPNPSIREDYIKENAVKK
ncbi:MAG: PIG-L deacetylase family protein [Bacteroidota bacterium]